MDGRTLGVVLLVALVALAGCSGGGGPGSPTADGEPDASDGSGPQQGTDTGSDDDSTRETPDADLEPLDLQAVRTGSGVNASALLLAHFRALNRSGSYRVETNRTVVAPEGTSFRLVTAAGSTTPLRQRYRVTRSFRNVSGSFLASRIDEYHTEDDRYERYNDTFDGQAATTTVSETTRQRTRRQYQRGTVGFTEADYFLMFEFAFAGNVTRDGTRLYRFGADAFAGADRRPRNATGPSATLLVDRTGVIRSADFQFVNANTGQKLSLSLETTAVGDVTVDEPDWTDETR
jgi:hypothetical protein